MTKLTNYLKLSLCFLIILVCSCKSKLKTDNAIYYCMDHLVLDSSQMNTIKGSWVKKIYVKFFDVFWNDERKAPNPTAKIEMDKKTKDWLKANGIEIIPVVFITNECLEKIYPGKYNELAERVYKLLDGQLAYFGMTPDIHEIQFNCDWTSSTRETYFNMINYMKLLPLIFDRKLTVSAAIYYDQCKDPKGLGVPPVNRAMLMCFSSLKQEASRNSIRTFKDDLADLGKYPLPMDIALALPPDKFLFRNNQLSGILQNMYHIKRTDSIISKIQPNQYKVNIDTVLNAAEVLKGDDIYEPPGDIERLLNYESAIKPKLSSNKAVIGIYWTDTSSARGYPTNYHTMIFNGMQ